MIKMKQISGLIAALAGKTNKQAITAGTKCKITYNEEGSVTKGEDLEDSDLPVVPVAKGGTGLSSVTENSYLKGGDSESTSLVMRTVAEVKTDLSLNNVTNHAQVKKAGSSTIGHIPKWSVNTGDEIIDGYGVRTSVRANELNEADDLNFVTELGIRKAIDASIGANDAMVYKGVIDASGNPNYPAADAGHAYKISVAGKIGGADGPNVEVGDMIICTTDDTAAGTHAAVGSSWNIIQANIDGAVTGPSSATNLNIAIFDGVSGKVIKDGGAKISDIQAGSTRQMQDRITDKTAEAGAVLNISAGLSQEPHTNSIGRLTINGVAYPRGSYSSLELGEWDNDRAGTPKNLRVRMPYAIEQSDEIVVVYNY